MSLRFFHTSSQVVSYTKMRDLKCRMLDRNPGTFLDSRPVRSGFMLYLKYSIEKSQVNVVLCIIDESFTRVRNR